MTMSLHHEFFWTLAVANNRRCQAAVEALELTRTKMAECWNAGMPEM
jgi:hypothetical protein